MTASKTRPAKYEDLVVLQVLMAKHYSAAAINLEIYTVYEQILRIKGELYKKVTLNWVCSFKDERRNGHNEYCPL